MQHVNSFLGRRWISTLGVIAGSLGAVVLAIALSLSTQAQSVPQTYSGPPSSQSDYPVLPDPPSAQSIQSTLADQVTWADIIVDATVIQQMPDVAKTIVLSPSTQSKLDQITGGTDSTSYTFGAIEFSVNETLAGDIGSPFVMLISPSAEGCVPTFAPGDRMVLFLYQSPDGSYFSVALQDAYWYVAKDQKIYPAVVTDKLKEYSGKGLGPFKSQINQIKNALKKK